MILKKSVFYWTIRLHIVTLSLQFIYVVAENVLKTQRSCSQLQPGQYRCDSPPMNKETQQVDCREDGRVAVKCYPVEGLICEGDETNGSNITFTKYEQCKYSNGKSFETALLLSVFLGMFGIDRMYLGYPAIGLLKFCTLGFMFLGQLVDVILIATQVVTPADGSSYEIDYYGAGLERVGINNETYFKPQQWD
ncbi:unnamed protein product [Owenia fusiformis]|uniref:TM2 domain-containing protein n=1 Tax=Owenia fusiformis TaxID=6347 RepID=A0A8S4N3X7_OWEFU|nr:unnamed protein product [Owenia fusiformis]